MSVLNLNLPPQSLLGSCGDGCGNALHSIRAIIRPEGYISLMLSHDMVVDIGINKAVRLTNTRRFSVLMLNDCGSQMFLNHPRGKVYLENSEIKVRSWLGNSYKKARIIPCGILLSSEMQPSMCIKMTEDGFFASEDCLEPRNYGTDFFLQTCPTSSSLTEMINLNVEFLQQASFSKTSLNESCWEVNGVRVIQAHDGFVTVHVVHGTDTFTLKSSPNNGKAKFLSSEMYMTASLGQEPHLFVKTGEDRVHCSGKEFVVRNRRFSASFDHNDLFQIW